MESIAVTGVARLENHLFRQIGLDARNEYLSIFRGLALHPPSQKFKVGDLKTSP
jgi:hypothetical protein